MSESNDFKVFLADKVNLNQTRLNLLSDRVSAIENFLTKNEEFRELMTEVVPQGSFGHGTIIKPVGTKEFDADILVPMNEVPEWSAAEYIQHLYEAFGRSATYKSMRSRKKRCVTIDYTGDFHVDVVPFVTRFGATYVANRATDRFELAAPEDFTEWFEGKNRTTNGNLVRVVRLLKYLRDHKTRYTVPSVTLTAALGHLVSESAKLFDPDAYKNVANTLQTLARALANQVENSPGRPPFISDPGTGQNLAERWQDDNYQTFRDRFTTYADWIDEAADENDYDNALKAWRRLFGDDFGADAGKASLSASLSPSTTPTSERFLDRDFGIHEKLDPAYQFKTVGYLIPRKGFRNGPLPKRGDRVRKGRSLKFKIESLNVPEPFDVYWKIRNYGDEATHAQSLRGDIHKDDGSRTWSESTSYIGHHYVEAMVVKGKICVARSRQDVIVI